MSDHAVRLNSVLDNLKLGRISLADAAAEVRKLEFPPRPRRSPGQLIRDTAEEDVPERPAAGSASELSLAYHEGRISYRQYEVLSAAVRSTEHGSNLAPGQGL